MFVNINSNPGRKFSEGNNQFHFSRQFSHGSARSTRSFKASSGNLLKKVEEHRLKRDTAEWQKQQEYEIRRKRRKEARKLLESRARLQHVRKLYAVTIVVIVFGIVMLFGSTVRTISDGTIFWTHKDKFKIIGSVVVVVGIVVLLVTVGLENKVLETIRASGELDVRPFIHPDFNNETLSFTRQDSQESSCSSYNTKTCRVAESRRKWYDTQSSGGEEDFLCSSLASNNSVPQSPTSTDFTTRWARAMALTIEETTDTNRGRRKSDNAEVVTFPRVSSEVLRLVHKAPNIDVTDIDASSISTLSRTNSETSFNKTPSFSSLSKLKSGEQEQSLKYELQMHRNGSFVNKDPKLRGISEENVSQIQSQQ